MTVVHILTVGTSLLGNDGGQDRDASERAGDVHRLNEACRRVRSQADDAPAGGPPWLRNGDHGVLRLLSRLDPRQEVAWRDARGPGRRHGPKDRLPQEVSYLVLHHDAHPDEGKSRCYLLTSGTQAGQFCAHIVRDYVNQHERLSEYYEVLEPLVIPGLDPGDPAAFETRGLRNLLDHTHALIDGSDRAGAGPIYLNLTGGFKALLAYGTLQGMVYASGGRFRGRLVLCYLFEDTPKIIYMPRYPIGVDFQHWHRNAVRLRMVLEGYEAFEPTLSPEMRNVLGDAGAASELSSFGRYLQREYERQLEQDPLTIYSREIIQRLLPEGLGETAAQLQDVLLRMVEPAGDLIWVGDKLPDVIDHALQHHHHLLEFAELFLTPVFREAPAFLDARERFCLLAGVLLHDCGHSLDYYKPAGRQTTMPLLAGEVRDFHHFLSAWRIDDREMAAELRWPGRQGFAQRALDPDLHDAVRAACIYHRRRVPYDHEVPDQAHPVRNDLASLWAVYAGSEAGDPGEDVEVPPLSRHPLRARLAQKGIDLLKVVMLLRLIDGCDMQARRAGRRQFVRQKLAMLARDYETASLRAEEARRAYRGALTSETCDAVVDLTAALEQEALADSKVRARARRRCVELLRDGRDDVRRLARLWSVAAEPIDLAGMKRRQREYYLNHQCVEEVQVVLRRGTRWTFDVVFVPAPEMGSSREDRLVRENGRTESRRERIEREVSSEYESVARYGSQVCGWRVCYWWREEYRRSDGERRPFYEPAP